MKIPKRAYYGMRAAIRLSASKNPISAHDLAKSERLPADFLEKILQKLKNSGIVVSKKGADGGYSLARPASGISAWDVLSALDSPFPRIDPPTPKGVLPCSIPSHCQTNEIWRTLEQKIEKTLSDITLDSLIR